MKVLMTTTYWKGCPGGIRTYVMNLVQELQSRGIEVEVAFREGKDTENYKISDNKSIFPIKMLNALRLLRKVRPDIIHSHGGMYHYLIAGYLYKINHDVKLLYTFHTEPMPEDGLSTSRRLVLQALLNRCDCVTFVSEKLRTKIKEIWRLDFRKSEITYAGAQPSEISEWEKREFCERFGIKSDSIMLLALGLTSLSYKAEGLKILIRAAKKVKEIYPNTILVATGRGPFYDELKEYAEKEGGGNDIFVGDIKNPYIPLSICNIYAHISLGEGLPIALLEAMAMGKPIIATPVGGIPEAIDDGKNGYLVMPEVDEIAKRIIYLIKNKSESDRIGRCAKHTSEDRFTWRASADKFVEIYRDNCPDQQ